MLDELERIRAFRADQPEPDQVSYGRARAALSRAIDAEAIDGARHRRRRRAPRRTLGRIALAGAAACAALTVAGIVGLDTAAAPQPALAAGMDHLARIAAGRQWSGIPGPGQYLYTRSYGPSEADTMAGGNDCVVTQVVQRQIWIATDGSGAIAQAGSDAKFTSPADQAVCAQMRIVDPASQDNTWSNSYPSGGLSFPTADWKALSTDPATLLKQVHQLDGGPNTPGEWFTNVADMLRESDAPATIRSALYRAAALIPGVRLMGTQQDPTGGAGLGVGYYQGGQLRTELIFNQQTAALQAEEGFDQSGKLSGWTVYEPSQIVDSHPGYPLANTTGSGTTTTATPSRASG